MHERDFSSLTLSFLQTNFLFASINSIELLQIPIFFVMASSESKPRTVEDIFRDFKARRTALVRALTQDVDEFYRQCDPALENLCLFGLPNEKWLVTTPSAEVPPEIPEPVVGINFARNGMSRKDWLYFVALHCDSWLLSVAFYPGARLNPSERERLFKLMNDLPTVYEILTGGAASKGKLPMDSGIKYGGSTEVNVLAASRSSDDQRKSSPKKLKRGIFCGHCGGIYTSDEFWITCTICEKRFHGSCVKMTPDKAMGTSNYKCPPCAYVFEGEHVR